MMHCTTVHRYIFRARGSATLRCCRLVTGWVCLSCTLICTPCFVFSVFVLSSIHGALRNPYVRVTCVLFDFHGVDCNFLVTDASPLLVCQYTWTGKVELSAIKARAPCSLCCMLSCPLDVRIGVNTNCNVGYTYLT